MHTHTSLSSSIRLDYSPNSDYLLILYVNCVVPCHPPLAFSYQKLTLDLQNLHRYLCACYAQKVDTGPNSSSPHKCRLRRTEQQYFTLSPLGVELWPWDLQCSALTNQPQIPSMVGYLVVWINFTLNLTHESVIHLFSSFVQPHQH